MSKRCMGCMELYGNEFEICPHCGYVEGTKAEEAIHMEPGTLLHDRYIVGKVLGFGGFGVTYIGWDGKLEQKVAIKEYLPSEFSTRMPGQSSVTVFNGEKSEQFHDGMNKFVEEAKHLAKFQNEPGIVRIFDSFTENETAYIIMEFLDGETLTSRLKREKTIPEDEAVKMLWPIMQSLQVVHAEGLLHRDIAPDNIFLTKDGDVKLIDFGASRYATTSHSRSLTVIIKPGYSPEEQYRSRGDQGPHTDVYALAATLYKMLTGKTPPDAMERRAKIENQKKEILEDPTKLNKNISLNRENAILNAMNVRIEDRTPDVAAFMEELNADPPAKRRYGKIKKIDLYHWPIWLKILVPSLLAVLLIFGILLATGVISFPSLFSDEVVVPDGMVSVPDVEGSTMNDAVAKLEGAGLLGSVTGNIDSEYIDGGKIVLQTPDAGTYIELNGTVGLLVSSGNGVIGVKDGVATVPQLIGMTEEEAIKRLADEGFATPIIERASNENVEAGLVSAQSLEYLTEVQEGTQITITVSTGPAAFDMPNVVNKTATEAQKTLEAKGLKVTLEYEKNNSVAEGNVISQSVSSGTQVKKGDSVTLKISSGKNTISVPNVVGMTRANATSTLEGKGFKVYVTESYHTSVASGNVISQNPGANTSQVSGTTITITVSKGARPITVYFNANGGSSNSSQISVYVGKNYGSLPSAHKDYNDFLGWFDSQTGGNQISSGSTVPDVTSITLYAHWSEHPVSGWVLSTEVPAGAQVVDSKTQYSYRDRQKQTTTSSNPTLAGYTRVGDPTYGNWGSWSAWSPGSDSSTDTKDVQTATVYGYCYFQCSNCGTHMWGWGSMTCYTWAGGCGRTGTIPEGSWHEIWTTTPKSSTSDPYGTGHAFYNDSTYGRLFYWNEGGSARNGYRTRTRTVTYTFEKWGEYGSWSAWQDASVSASDSREVRTQTVCRYRSK